MMHRLGLAGTATLVAVLGITALLVVLNQATEPAATLHVST
jgi:hypothetical protein